MGSHSGSLFFAYCCQVQIHNSSHAAIEVKGASRWLPPNPEQHTTSCQQDLCTSGPASYEGCAEIPLTASSLHMMAHLPGLHLTVFLLLRSCGWLTWASTLEATKVNRDGSGAMPTDIPRVSLGVWGESCDSGKPQMSLVQSRVSRRKGLPKAPKPWDVRMYFVAAPTMDLETLQCLRVIINRYT